MHLLLLRWRSSLRSNEEDEEEEEEEEEERTQRSEAERVLGRVRFWSQNGVLQWKDTFCNTALLTTTGVLQNASKNIVILCITRYFDRFSMAIPLMTPLRQPPRLLLPFSSDCFRCRPLSHGSASSKTTAFCHPSCLFSRHIKDYPFLIIHMGTSTFIPSSGLLVKIRQFIECKFCRKGNNNSVTNNH